MESTSAVLARPTSVYRINADAWPEQPLAGREREKRGYCWKAAGQQPCSDESTTAFQQTRAATVNLPLPPLPAAQLATHLPRDPPPNPATPSHARTTPRVAVADKHS
jgi:hypothetical protein